MNYLLSCLLVAVAVLPVAAQKTPARATPKAGPNPAFTLTCAGQVSATQLQKLYCETRDLTLPAPPAGTPLTVDARAHGSITVRAWAGKEVRVRARVEAKAATIEAAKALATAVRVSSQGSTVRAARANESLDGWEVSYEVLVPMQTNLVLQAVNGNVSLEEVQGNLRAETSNGNLVLKGVGGDVRAKTANGNLTITLTGANWQGPGLDASTSNGAVTWLIPATYAATLTARTTRGRVQAELNTARKNLLPHNLVATLGKGGAQLRAATVNGDVLVKQEPLPKEVTEEEEAVKE